MGDFQLLQIYKISVIYQLIITTGKMFYEIVYNNNLKKLFRLYYTYTLH